MLSIKEIAKELKITESEAKRSLDSGIRKLKRISLKDPKKRELFELIRETVGDLESNKH